MYLTAVALFLWMFGTLFALITFSTLLFIDHGNVIVVIGFVGSIVSGLLILAVFMWHSCQLCLVGTRWSSAKNQDLELQSPLELKSYTFN